VAGFVVGGRRRVSVFWGGSKFDIRRDFGRSGCGQRVVRGALGGARCGARAVRWLRQYLCGAFTTGGRDWGFGTIRRFGA